MILGMSTETFTLIHVLISLVGIGSGLVALYGWITARSLDGWTTLFLWSTVLTSVTGFLFPITKVTPGLILGGISLVVLALALVAKYMQHLAGGWRRIFVITSVAALYFNVFVAVVQSFEKIPALHALAPKGNEPPFAVAQLIVLVAFVWLGWKAVKGFSIASAVRPVSVKAA